MTQEAFQKIASSIPLQPGIYKYFDSDNTIIYVGKAKSLRKRVSSYFNKTGQSYKTHELVQRIHHIEFTIVDTEQDAFLLENALIKQFQPKYNIMLKDDKTYPFITIKKEHFPRIYLTRQKLKDGSEYIGPFTSVMKVREVLDFVKMYIPLRTCKLNLTPNNIKAGKFKVCLEYHLGNCKGPCEGLQSEEDYAEGIRQIREIVKGNLTPVFNHLKGQMAEYVENMQFEKAAQVKHKIEGLETYQAKSVIVSKHLGNMDVFSIVIEEDTAFVNFLLLENGTIVLTDTVELVAKIEESEADILAFAISQLREKFNSHSPEIIVPIEIEYPDTNVQLTIPKAGDKKKLLELSEKNVHYFREELRKKKRLQLVNKTDEQHMEALEHIKKDLQLPALPVHIECFDNSNFQGSYPVSAMVCFKNGVPSKKDYRHFNVKTVTGIDDFASMYECVYRRYKRLKEENQSLPQLVIIDGGKGQLGAAMRAIADLDLLGKMTLVGLAKREEELFFPGDSESLKLSWDSQSLNLIRFIRDQVHRFGITFHRNQRSKGTFSNELEAIPGIGKQTAENLLKRFRSISNIKRLTERELTGEVGISRAATIWNYFHNPDEPSAR